MLPTHPQNKLKKFNAIAQEIQEIDPDILCIADK